MRTEGDASTGRLMPVLGKLGNWSEGWILDCAAANTRTDVTSGPG